MVYIINLLFSCIYLSLIRGKTLKSYLIKCIPVILIWTIIVGGQKDVGTDYPVYLAFFEYPAFVYEPIFCGITLFLFENGLKGQDFFFLYACITALVFFIAAYSYKLKKIWLLYFLMVVVATFFNAQMNGLRQCVAVPLVFGAFHEFFESNSKWKGAILIVIAAGFHYSALIGIFFIFMDRFLNLTKKVPRILLLLCCVAPFITLGEGITEKILSYLPRGVVAMSRLSNYMNSQNADQELALIFRLSKLYFIPLYWWCVSVYKKMNLSEYEDRLFWLGILSFFLKNILLVNVFIGRFGYYFWLPSIFPLYFIIRYYQGKKDYGYSVLIMLYCCFIYFYKVIAGTQGYTYDFYKTIFL